MNLYELIRRSNEIEQSIVDNGGEITELQEQLQADLLSDVKTKAEQYWWVIKRLEEKSKFFKLEEDKLAKTKKSLNKMSDTLEETLKNGMLLTGLNEIYGQFNVLKLQNTPDSLIIENEELVPKDYKVMKWEIDKAKLKSDLSSGIKVPGAHLEKSLCLREYGNKKIKELDNG